MRRICAVIVAALSLQVVPPAAGQASEIAVKLDGNAQNAVAQLPALLDSCVAGVMMRGDSAVCRTLSNFLAAFGNEVRSAQAAATKAEADEAAKKAAEKPADKPADPPAAAN